MEVLSASLAASFGPPGSSGANTIQTFAFLIPILAIGLLCAASPHFRAQIRRVKSRWHNYFYPPVTYIEHVETKEAEEVKDELPVSELTSFDHSIYDEYERDDPDKSS